MFGPNTILIDWGTSKIAWYVNGEIHTMPNLAAESPAGLLVGEAAREYFTQYPAATVLRPSPGKFCLKAEAPAAQGKAIFKEIKPTVPWYRRLFRFDVLVALPKDLTPGEGDDFMAAVRPAVGGILLVDGVMAAASLSPKPGQAVAVVEIGAGFAAFAVVKCNRYLQIASRRVGGCELDAALAKHLAQDHGVVAIPEELEKLRCQLGSRETFRIGAAELSREEIQHVYWAALDDFAEAMNAELQKAPEEVRQQGLALSGGLAGLTGIAAYFERKTGCRCRIVDRPEKAVIRGLPKLLEEIRNALP